MSPAQRKKVETRAAELMAEEMTLRELVKIPNAETLEALRQARAGEGLTEYSDLEDLKSRHG